MIQSTEPISKCAIAAIESMSFGDVEEREWVFTLSTSRGAVKLAAETEEGTERATNPSIERPRRIGSIDRDRSHQRTFHPSM